MKKRLAILLLVISLLTLPAQARENSIDNFIRGANGRTYTNQFSDLQAGSVFYKNVTALYEYGLSVGKPDGTFGLQDNLTVSQVIIFAGRIRSTYRTGDPEKGPAAYVTETPQATCMPYLAYLKAEQVLGSELDGLLFTQATRAQMAHVLANVLPRELLPAINSESVTTGYASRRFIPDVTEYTPYQQDILFLYRSGISQGSDSWGSFFPNAPITRGAVAAMLTRLVDPTLRVTLNWDFSKLYSAQGATYASLAPAGKAYTAPNTEQQMLETVQAMFASGSNTLKLQYAGMTETYAYQLMNWALRAAKTHCEQSYNSVSLQYYTSGQVQMTFSAAGHEANLSRYRQETLAAAIAVHDRLWAEGAITADMTEHDKALAYYTWICENCVYDNNAGPTSLSHLPYRLFAEGTAVCDGYTGAYNLLLRLEGIDCHAVFNADHIWTVATLDGTEVHIDTTWADQSGGIRYTYFAMTPSMSELLHK